MASLTPLRQFGSYALDSSNGVQLGEWSDTILWKATYASRMDGQGALFSREATDGRRIAMKGTIAGVDSGAARALWELFMQRLAAGEQYLQLWHDRRISARLERDVKRTWVEGSSHTVIRWSASLRSRFPTWESITPVTGLKVLSSAVDTYVMPGLSGTAPTFPRVVITNNGGQFDGKSLVLTAGGRQLALTGLSMSYGQTLTVDFREGQLDMAGGQEPRPVSIEGGFFALDEGVATTWEFSTDVSSPNLWISVECRPQYWEA